MKNKQMYLDSGYLDFRAVVDDECPFAFVVGGRGTGKTFGALKYCYDHWKETGRPFIYMRRTKTQAELVSTDIFNPFRPLNDLYGYSIQPYQVSKGVYGFYETCLDSDGKRQPSGSYIGIIAALSTFSNFRGFDGSNVDIIVYDEFIRNAGEKALKDEGFSLMNVFETVNRNRELIGGVPVKLICLSNSNAISNDIFRDMQLVSRAEWMRSHGKNQYYDFGRGIALYDLADSTISRKKKDTALYRMDQEGSYSKMALDNEYHDLDPAQIKSEPLKEFRLMVSQGELNIYEHKSDPRYYVSTHRSGTAPTYGVSAIEKTRFVRKYPSLWEAYLQERMSFESFACKKMFEDLYV